MAYEKDPDEIGAAWEKSGKNGTYLTGQIEINGEKVRIVMFRNGNKKSEKSPDFRILRSKPQGERAAAPAADFDSPF